jgi:hypothetical protein
VVVEVVEVVVEVVHPHMAVDLVVEEEPVVTVLHYL